MAKISILTFEDFQRRRNIGSSKIRAKWLLNHWPEAELYIQGKKYDTVIFQKVYWTEFAKEFDGIKILDICDPDWLQWGIRIKEMIDYCDGIVCNTLDTALYVRKLSNENHKIAVIPDRIDFDILPKPRPRPKEIKTAVWFGYSQNFTMLQSAVNSLIKAGIEKLIVCSDGPFSVSPDILNKLELVNYPYDENSIYADIKKGDICINPQSKDGTWKYKSNNKSILAAALGLPVAHNEEELNCLMDDTMRNKIMDDIELNLKKDYDVINSVNEYKELIDNIIKEKEGVENV